jgi:hypothetical protein
MRLSVHVVGAATVILTLLAGCGTIIRPHVSTGGNDRLAGSPPTERLGPRLAPENETAPGTSSLVDQVCRVHAMRSGWIATRYIEAAGDCPESTDPENLHNAAVIERYSHLPVGATMAVCADQPVPRDWVREHNREVKASCPGARVQEGAPTVFVIRRVSARS